jgi:hypothetical protein
MDAHHHQITKLSHSINAIGPAPHRMDADRTSQDASHTSSSSSSLPNQAIKLVTHVAWQAGMLLPLAAAAARPQTPHLMGRGADGVDAMA